MNILDTFNNKWKTAQPLPRTASYRGVIVNDTVYLVGWDNQTVLRAHVPTLISGAKSDVWETVTNTPYYWSSPVTIGNTLLTVGGIQTSHWVVILQAVFNCTVPPPISGQELVTFLNQCITLVASYRAQNCMYRVSPLLVLFHIQHMYTLPS